MALNVFDARHQRLDPLTARALGEAIHGDALVVRGLAFGIDTLTLLEADPTALLAYWRTLESLVERWLGFSGELRVELDCAPTGLAAALAACADVCTPAPPAQLEQHDLGFPLSFAERARFSGRRSAGPVFATPMLLEGSLAIAATYENSSAPYVQTSLQRVERMLDIAEVQPADVVYDLGSGDGRIVFAAARRGCRAVGIEASRELVAQARADAAKHGLGDRATFVHADLFHCDLSEATVVAMFLMSTVNRKLLGKLRAELKPGARIVSSHFAMGDWAPEVHTEEDIYLWRC